MTSSAPPPRDDSGSPRRRPELSVTQIAASALAAVTATFAASYFGVSGTIIGAALASVVTVVGSALYSHSIHRTRERVLGARPAGTAPATGPGQASGPRRTIAWQRAALGAAGLFLLVAGIVTGIELAAGRPLDKIVHDKAGSGTSLFGGGHQTPAPARTPTEHPATRAPRSTSPSTAPRPSTTPPTSPTPTSLTPTPTPTESDLSTPPTEPTTSPTPPSAQPTS